MSPSSRTPLFLTILLIFISISAAISGNESYKFKKILSELNRTTDSFKKTELLIDAGNEIKGTNPDTAIYYFLQAEKRLAGLSDQKQITLLQTKIFLGRISIALTRGAYADAMMYDSLALLNAKKLKNKALEAQAMMSLGSIYYNQSQYEKAQKINIQALLLNRQTSDRKTEGKILTNMGTIEFILGNAKKADSLFRIPLKIAAQSNDDDLLGASYLNLGLLNYYKGQYDEAAAQFRMAIQVYLKIDGRDGLAICYQNLSNIGFARGDISMVLDNTWLHMAISRQLGDKINEAKAFHNLGEASMLLGDYERALEYFMISLNIKDDLKDLTEVALTELSIGHIHFKSGNYPQAFDYYQKASQHYEKTKYMIGIGKGYSALGNVMTEWKKPDSALIYYRKAEKIFRDTEEISSLAATFLNLGTIFLTIGDTEKAEQYFLLGQEKGYELEDPNQIFKSFLLLSTLKTTQANNHTFSEKKRSEFLKDALGYSNIAFKLADSAGFLDKKKEASNNLMRIYIALGDYAKAMHYAELTMAFSDSLAGRQRAEAIAHAEIRWKAEKKQSEINQLTKERLLQSSVIAQTSKLNNRLIWLIIFILSVFVLMIIIAVQYIKNKEKQKKILFQLHMKEVTLLKHKNLNNRLSPHMFFNLLNSLGDSLEEREKMMHQIRETTSLLRSSLENAEEMAIPLSRELDMVKSYLELQKSRIPEPFTLEILIGDTVNMDALLPAMSIHIPVENAIKHGLMPLEGSKVLKINIENQKEELRISVLDNGIGRLDSEKRTKGTGTGLKLIYQTIHLLNQQNRKPIKVSINDLEPRGTEFSMTIPRNYSFELKTI